MSPEDRTERMTIRFSPTERAMIEALSERTGLTQADVVRQTIRRAYEEAFGDVPPRPPSS